MFLLQLLLHQQSLDHQLVVLLRQQLLGHQLTVLLDHHQLLNRRNHCTTLTLTRSTNRHSTFTSKIMKLVKLGQALTLTTRLPLTALDDRLESTLASTTAKTTSTMTSKLFTPKTQDQTALTSLLKMNGSFCACMLTPTVSKQSTRKRKVGVL